MGTSTTVPSPEKSFLSSAAIDTAAAATIALVALIALKRVRVYRIWLISAAAQVATFKDSAGTQLEAQIPLGGFVWDFDGLPWTETGLGLGLSLTLANAVQTSGRVWYTQRDDS